MNFATKFYKGLNGYSVFSKNLIYGNCKTQPIRTFCTNSNSGAGILINQ